MKLFGRKLFNFKRKEKVIEMYDFAQHGLLNGGSGNTISDYISFESAAVTVQPKKKRGRPKEKLTPKALYELKSLNDNDFNINVDESYLKEQLVDLEDKLSLFDNPRRKTAILESLSGGIKFAAGEILSIIQRLENRRKISQFKSILEEYPHTTSRLINQVLKDNDHLKCKIAKEFIPDFPRDAVQAMKKYNDMCTKLTGKTTHFYVIASEDDFNVKDKRRDPILLAQSPFGFFWQILGAWDEEMVYLGDL